MARIGDRNKYLVFQAPSKDANGVISWTTIFSCYGSYKPLSGNEAVQAMVLNGAITGKVRIAYRPVNVLTTWRILFKGKALNIASPPINIEGKNVELEMKIKEAG